ncbi:hypothetical protein F383_37682 [Gossypium arboreum]|uniref:Uncharacterized protein n=1 Tax=Gossypium arboreum TaxID=29729 RepID=A0A0B0MFQ1_GOSAR|nr:hypothetical protein F383_37682 [Gossypium arboreum]
MYELWFISNRAYIQHTCHITNHAWQTNIITL